MQALISRVWSRWLTEYLPTLSTRSKWKETVKDLKNGDVVLALENDLPRRKWPLGRIVETYPGRDGHTRVAKVQCGERTLVRPIHKLGRRSLAGVCRPMSARPPNIKRVSLLVLLLILCHGRHPRVGITSYGGIFHHSARVSVV